MNIYKEKIALWTFILIEDVAYMGFFTYVCDLPELVPILIAHALVMITGLVILKSHEHQIFLLGIASFVAIATVVFFTGGMLSPNMQFLLCIILLGPSDSTWWRWGFGIAFAVYLAILCYFREYAEQVNLLHDETAVTLFHVTASFGSLATTLYISHSSARITAIHHDFELRVAGQKVMFLRECSHELRTPINGILGAASALLTESSGLSANQHELARLVYLSSQSLERVTKDLMKSHLDLSKVAADITETMRHGVKLVDLSGCGVNANPLQLDISSIDHPFWRFDPARTSQLVVSLISFMLVNATNSHTPLVITARMVTEKEVVFVDTPGDYCRVSLVIYEQEPSKQKEGNTKLQRFEQSPYRETLRHATHAIIVMGGAGCICCSEAGVSRVEFAFPTEMVHELHDKDYEGFFVGVDEKHIPGPNSFSIQEESSPPSSPQRAYRSVSALSYKQKLRNTAKRAKKRKRKRKHITALVVDDNKVNLTVLMLHLSSLLCYECSVDVANDGLEALQMCQQYETCPWDIIFMDLYMPVMNGKEATQHIRQLPGFRIVPIVVSSAIVHIEAHEEQQFTDVLPKPVSKREVSNLFRRLRVGQYLDKQ